MSEAPACLHCGAPLRAVSRYCGRCGRPIPTVRRARREAERGDPARGQRVALAVAVVFGGVILGIVLGAMVAEGAGGAAVVGLTLALDLAAGALALRLLGPGAFRSSLPLRTEARWPLLAVPLGLVVYGAAAAYVEALRALLGVVAPATSPSAVTILAVVVVAPLIEEWLCRGVLWTAVSRVVGTPIRIVVVTAALFAVMHGMQGIVFALPHRFIGGLLLGWIRWRSGSLLPGVVAHLTWNAAAIVVAPGG